MISITVTEMLEDIRDEIREERISYGEIADLQAYVAFIPLWDTELLEWAGVPERGAFDFHVEHEDCDAEWSVAFPVEGQHWFEHYSARFTGTPIWECKRCGDKFTYHEAWCTEDDRHVSGCSCDVLEFSWSACHACGSTLGGSRHAYTVWDPDHSEKLRKWWNVREKPEPRTEAGKAIWHNILNGAIDLDPEVVTPEKCDEIANWALEEWHEVGDDCVVHACESGDVTPLTEKGPDGQWHTIPGVEYIARNIDADVYHVLADALAGLAQIHDDDHDSRWPVGTCTICRPVLVGLMILEAS